MATQSSYRFRLDGTVTLTLLLVAAVSLFVLAFRFKNSKPCYPITLNRDSVFFQDVPIFFKASAKDAQTFEWDFNDGTSAENSSAATVIHTYRQTGRYTVKVTVNDHCEAWKEVRIVARPVEVDKTLRASFSGPDTAVAGTPVTFTDHTPDATAWEWRFGETDDIDNTNRTATYLFKTPGPKEIYLKVNGRNDMATIRTIYVKTNPQLKAELPKPPPKPAGGGNRPRLILPDTPRGQPNIIVPVEVKKAPEISSAVLEGMLTQVASGKKTAADFSEYLCGNLSIQVVYNGSQMAFPDMCAVIRKIDDEDDIKKVSVVQYKDENLCIKSLNVTLKLRSWLGRRTH